MTVSDSILFLNFNTEQLHKMNVGLTHDSVKSIGESFMQKITRALWYIDPHHEKFADRGIHLPPHLGAFQGYNDYKRKKEKEPRISADELNHHVQELSGMLMQPWFCKRRFELLRNEVKMFVDAMQKYGEYLKGKSALMKEHHQSMEPDHPKDNASLATLPIASGPIPADYVDLNETLQCLPHYQPLLVNEYAPDDTYKRRSWLAKLARTRLPNHLVPYAMLLN